MPVAKAEAHSEEFAISFGDEPAAAPQKYTKFELVNQWKLVQKDYCQMEPLAGAYLDGTLVQRGDFNVSPFAIKILFRADNAFNYNQFCKSDFYKSSLTEYLETILQTKVQIQTELIPLTTSEAAARKDAEAPRPSTPISTWERDKTREPILQFLADTFEVTWLDSKSVRRVQRRDLPEINVDE